MTIRTLGRTGLVVLALLGLAFVAPAVGAHGDVLATDDVSTADHGGGLAVEDHHGGQAQHSTQAQQAQHSTHAHGDHHSNATHVDHGSTDTNHRGHGW